VISVALKTPLQIRLGICIHKTSFLHRPDEYVGLTPSCPPHILQQNCAHGDHYPIYLTVSKACLKRDIKQRFLRDTKNVDVITFDRDLHETLDSLPMQKYSEWNVNEKFDHIVRTMKSLADAHMPVRKYKRREYKLKLKP